jgi:hypothetical protein
MERRLLDLGIGSGTVCLYRRMKGSARKVIGSEEGVAKLPEENPNIYIV